MNELPLVMLGIRTAWREDVECSPADLVYGTTLHIPGEFFEAPRTSMIPPGFLCDLQHRMHNIEPPRTTYHGRMSHYNPPCLGQSGWVYVRQDGHRTPLQRPYAGPYRVVRKDCKFFTLNINGKEDTVSIDRLKPAYIT